MKRPLALLFVWPLVFAAAMGAGHLPEPQPVSVESLFTSTGAQRIEITLAPEEIQSLRDKPRKDVAAQVRLGRGSPSPASVRLKGHGTFRTIDHKASFTLKLQDNVRKIHLNNSVEDATCLQERLASDLFHSAGVPSPRVAHVQVTLNGRRLGVYVLKEGFTRAFLQRSFGGGDGELSESEPPELLAAAAEPDLSLRWQKLSEVLDPGGFASFLATEVLIGHWDGYATAGNNFRVYHHAGKFHFLPTGMDQTFGNPRSPALPGMTGRVARALLETPEGRMAFQLRFRELAERFSGAECATLAGTYARSIATGLNRSEYREMRESLSELQARIVARGEFLQREPTLFL